MSVPPSPRRPVARAPAAANSTRAAPRTGLRPLSELPPRAKLVLAVAEAVILGFAVWVTISLLEADDLALAIVLIVLSYVGVVVVGLAAVTVTRMVFSLSALPYLLGRGVRRLLGGR